jgi:aminoglycoside/choline kinase family phosphotransferase
MSWLFLEDAGTQAFSEDRAADRALAADWLGRLHGGAMGLELAGVLDDTGPSYYLEELREARSNIETGLRADVASPTASAELRATLERCEQLESAWSAVTDRCALVPRTLVHGDMIDKNLRIRTNAGVSRVVAFDWETVGWAVPAPDLHFFAFKSPAEEEHELRTYVRAVRSGWPDATYEHVRELMLVGAALRAVMSINWATYTCKLPWIDDLARHVRHHRGTLEQALPALGIGA